MFDKDAAFMLKVMKTSGNIPGALHSEDVVNALAALEERLQLENNNDNGTEDTENSAQKNDDYVGINTKALPLIELMQRSIDKNEKLLWDKG